MYIIRTYSCANIIHIIICQSIRWHKDRGIVIMRYHLPLVRSLSCCRGMILPHLISPFSSPHLVILWWLLCLSGHSHLWFERRQNIWFCSYLYIIHTQFLHSYQWGLLIQYYKLQWWQYIIIISRCTCITDRHLCNVHFWSRLSRLDVWKYLWYYHSVTYCNMFVTRVMYYIRCVNIHLSTRIKCIIIMYWVLMVKHKSVVVVGIDIWQVLPPPPSLPMCCIYATSFRNY